jgi:nitrate/nitrite transporter NarK
MTAKEAFRTPAFWRLASFHGLRNIPYGGVTVHLVPLLVWKGVDQPTAAFFVGLLSFATVIIRPLTGWLGDRWPKQRIGAMGVFLGGLGLAVLLGSHGSYWHMALFVILFSFADAINSITWALVGDFFGRKSFATIRGWIGMIQSFATMPAAVFTGWVYDHTQSYTAAILPFMILYGMAALVLWQAAPPAQNR